MSRRIISLYFNAAGENVNAAGEAIAVSEEPVFHPDEIVVVNCRFFQTVTGAGEVPAALPIDAALRVGLAAYEEISGTRLFQAVQSDDPAVNRVNLAGDWNGGLTADRAAGQLSFRVATSNADLANMLTWTRTVRFKLRILGAAADALVPTVLGAVPFQVTGRPVLEAISRTELEAMLQAPEEYEFRLDENSAWHAVQSSNDRWYRIRRGDGAWGTAIRLPVGSGIRIDRVGLLSARPATLTGLTTTMNYFATDTGLVYCYRNGAWSEGISLRGPAGSAAPREIPGFELQSPVYDPERGMVGVLDTQTDSLAFRYRIADATRIVLGVVSASPEVTGNVVLIPVVDGIERTAAVVPVSSVEQCATLNLTLFGTLSGTLKIRRACADSRDTLRDGTPVSVLVTYATLVLQ